MRIISRVGYLARSFASRDIGLCSNSWINRTVYEKNSLNKFQSIHTTTRTMSWGYTKDNGPSTWKNVAPIADGKRQSPIDIDPATAVYDPKLSSLKWTYTPNHAQKLLNTGKSAQVVYDAAGSLLEGGPLADKYKIAQFHLHWGKGPDSGSEHRVNGKMYAAELHIVHWNSDKYGSFGEAADKPDGLCVLGVFLQAGGTKDHIGLQKMTQLLKDVTYNGDSVTVPGGFDPACVLPDDKGYWTYLGSLTTPPLYESVTWIVFRQPIVVSDAQMEAFRSLEQCCKGEPAVQDEFGGKICENYRPPCPLEGRQVRASFQ